MPAVAGLAVGIAFVILFSALMTPSSQFSRDGRLISSTNEMREAQAFFSEYPDGNVKVDRTKSETSGFAVRYSFEKVYDDGKVNQVRMFVMIDDRTAKPTGEMDIDCVLYSVNGFGAMTYSITGSDMAEILQTTECAK